MVTWEDSARPRRAAGPTGAYQRPSSFRMTTMTTMAPIKVMMPIACLRPGLRMQMTSQPHSYRT